MEHSSLWSAHLGKACSDSCWYCNHPPEGSRGIHFVLPKRGRLHLGKAGRKAAKRERVRLLKRTQATA
jgi:hypothetical protein